MVSCHICACYSVWESLVFSNSNYFGLKLYESRRLLVLTLEDLTSSYFDRFLTNFHRYQS